VKLVPALFALSAFVLAVAGCGKSNGSGATRTSSGGTSAAGGTNAGGATATGGSGGETGGSGGAGAGGVAGAPAKLSVDAGADVTIALPTRTVMLHGSATANDGTTPSLSWTQVSGTDATLAGTSNATLTVSGLVPGVYVLRLTATTPAGASASDDVQVTLTSSGQTYFVTTAGSDSGDGSTAHPWATLAKACASVSGAGDVIHVAAGTYNETAQCVLAPQVSLEGEGDATHVVVYDTGDNVYAAGIQLASTTGGTDGSQSISKLWLDGNDVAHNCILVRGRSHVLVRHVKFTNMLASALTLLPVGSWGQAPPVYEQGNELSSSTSTDCSDRTYGGGVILMGGQQGAIIRDNTFDQTGRPQGHNGNVMGAVFGHNKGWSYYRNVSTKPDYDGPMAADDSTGWNFALEVWANDGGAEIWGNTFNGGGNAIDVGGGDNSKGDYAYSWYVHDNVFQLDKQLSTTPTDTLAPMAVQFETPTSDAIVSNNRFVRLAHGIQIILSHTGDTVTQRIAIHNNVFEDMGFVDGSFGGTMVAIGLSQGTLIDSISIDNNTMLSGTNGHARAAVWLDNENPSGTISNIAVRDNIVENVSTWGYLTFNGDSSIVGVTSSHNILFQNADANAAYTHVTTSLTPSVPTVTGFAESGNLMMDPELGPDLHPLPGSPALGAGIDVGYGTTIGAYPK
jgi:K319L-like, PKD domain